MTHLAASALVAVADPAPIIAKICEHLTEHDAVIEAEGPAQVVTFAFGRGRLTALNGALEMQAEAPDVLGLYYMRMTLAGHLREFVGKPAPEVVWTGDGSDIVTPPNFRPVRVAAVRSLTPHTRRITFIGADLGQFGSEVHLHLGIVLPPEGGAFMSPMVGKDGLLHMGQEGTRPVIRYYTVRRFDAAAGQIDVDFVLHDDAGPGCAFAARAQVGDLLGITGPFGGGIRTDRDWYLLGGDETALPAIARMLNILPAIARGVALIEVAGPEEEQPLVHGTGIEVRWLHRGGDMPGVRLAEAVRRAELPTDMSFFVWTACEFASFKTIRHNLRKERGLSKDQHLAVAYWRAGHTDEDMDAE